MRSLALFLLLIVACQSKNAAPVAVVPGENPTVSRATPAQGDTPPPRQKTSGQLGINLATVSYYSSEIVFNDAFKVAKPWISQAPNKPYGEGGPLELDEFGNVKKLAEGGQFAETLIFADLEGHYPGGDYTCFFEGDGEIQFLHAAKIIKTEPGKLTVRVTPKTGPIGMQLLKTNPKNPIRKIRLMLPGCAELPPTEPFHSSLLKFLDGFSTIRFMDWGQTNGSKVKEWADRTTPEHLFQGNDNGVAIEYMLELANRARADAWICVPHLASDDYVAHLMELVQAKLAPDRKLYLEFSNETWNLSFEQARDCQRLGLERKYANNDFEAQLKFSAKRSQEIFRIAAQIVPPPRLIRVLAPQAVNLWSATTMMDFINASEEVDAIAIAPYFGYSLGNPETAAEVAKLDVTAVLDECRKNIRENQETLRKYLDEVSQRNLELIAYEGGQHLVGNTGAQNDEALTKLFLAANRHPTMFSLYLEDLNHWKSVGGGLFCLFNSVGTYSKWGSWGLLESSDQNPKTSPKLQAVREFLRTNLPKR